jgi:hypothetical protein
MYDGIQVDLEQSFMHFLLKQFVNALKTEAASSFQQNRFITEYCRIKIFNKAFRVGPELFFHHEEGIAGADILSYPDNPFYVIPEKKSCDERIYAVVGMVGKIR